jgi:Ca-activated chloride channel family protein
MVTRLHDAVGLTLEQELRAKQGRKALVLFSDGVDWGSRTYNTKGNIALAQEADLVVYPILFNTFPKAKKRAKSAGIFRAFAFARQQKLGRMYSAGKEYLKNLAEVSGGTLNTTSGLATLGVAFRKIATELRSLYTLGYISSNERREGRFRRISVRVRHPNTHVKHKKGYQGPRR